MLKITNCKSLIKYLVLPPPSKMSVYNISGHHQTHLPQLSNFS